MRTSGVFKPLVIALVTVCLLTINPLVIGPLVAQDTNSGQADAKTSAPGAVRLYRSAVASQNDGNFDLAAADYRELLAKHPDDPLAEYAQHYLGVCTLQTKKYDEAIKSLQAVLTKHPKFKLLDSTYFNLGKAQAAKGQPAKAAEMFAALADERFKNSKLIQPALYERGEALYNANQKKAALAAYEQFVKSYPKHNLYPDALYALGVAQQELGMHEAADATFARFLAEKPQHSYATEVGMRRADALYAQEKYDEAEKLFAKAAGVEGFAYGDYSLVRQGESLFAQKKYDRAAQVFLKLASEYGKSPYNTVANLTAGKALYLLEKNDQARAALGKVLSAGDAQPAQVAEAGHWIAKTLLKEGKYAEAHKAAEAALARSEGTEYHAYLLLDRADSIYESPDGKKQSIPLYLAIVEADAKHPLAPQALYYAAFAAQAGEDYGQAQALAERFLKEYSGNEFEADICNVLAESQLQTGKHAEAAKAFTDLLTKYASHRNRETWLVRAALAMHLAKETDKVIATLEPAVANIKDPEAAAEAQYLLGASFFEKKDYAKAVAALRASLAAAPQWRQADETLLLLSRAQQAAGDTKGAIDSVKKLVADFPNSQQLARAHYRYGEYAQAVGDYDAALREHQAVLDAGTDAALAPYSLRGLGLAHQAKKDYPAAEKAFAELIEKHADHEITPRAYLLRAQAREQLKNYGGAATDAQAFLKSNPSDDDKSIARHVLGVALDRQKKHAEAAEVFKKLLADDPGYSEVPRILYELAWSQKLAKQDADSTASFARLAAEHPDSPLAADGHFHVGEAHYLQATAAKKDGDDGWKALYAKAAAEYDKAKAKVGDAPLGENILYKLGWSAFQQEKYDAAEEAFTAQIGKFPQGQLAADARFMIGESLFKQGKYKEAVAALDKSLAAPPANETFVQLARLHAAQSASRDGQYQQAISQLDKLLTDFPKTAFKSEAQYELGWAKHSQAQADPNQVDQKLLDEALKDYAQVIESDLGETGAKAQFMSGEIQFLRKDYKAAARSFNQVANAFGTNSMQADALFELARCFELLQNPKSAANYYKKLIADHPSSDKVAAARKALERLGESTGS